MSDVQDSIETSSNKKEYTLEVKEVDQKEVFWTGKVPFKSSITCQFKESDLNIPISTVLYSYVPKKVLNASNGKKHLTTGTGDAEKQVQLSDPLQVLFEKDSKVATLHLQFGAMLNGDEFLKNEHEYYQGMENLKKALNIPGFLDSKYGKKLQSLMAQIEEEYKSVVPNAHEVQQKLVEMNRSVTKALRDFNYENAVRKKPNYYSLFAYGALIVAAVAYFVFKALN